MTRIIATVAAAVASSAVVLATSQTPPPDLSGTWVLDVAASDFAKEAQPAKKVVTIQQRGSKLTMTVAEEGQRGAVNADAQYLTDGTPVTNPVLGNLMTTVAKWEGPELVMTTTGTFADNEITLVDRYVLSADGKTLTIRRHFEGKQWGGVQDQVLVHRKIN
jgi:hypothetical protein